MLPTTLRDPFLLLVDFLVLRVLRFLVLPFVFLLAGCFPFLDFFVAPVFFREVFLLVFLLHGVAFFFLARFFLGLADAVLVDGPASLYSLSSCMWKKEIHVLNFFSPRHTILPNRIVEDSCSLKHIISNVRESNHLWCWILRHWTFHIWQNYHPSIKSTASDFLNLLVDSFTQPCPGHLTPMNTGS